MSTRSKGGANVKSLTVQPANKENHIVDKSYHAEKVEDLVQEGQYLLMSEESTTYTYKS